MRFDASRWLVVVPARIESTRLPKKPLQDLGGAPLVVRVYRNLAPLKASGAEIVVATDAEEVRAACERHGVPARLTRPDHESGTDRCAEVAASATRPYVLNVQGDEPFVAVSDLVALMEALEARPGVDMATLAYRSDDPGLAADPNVVKAVRAESGRALYFSRAPVPYDRDGKGAGGHLPLPFWQHLGIYAFVKERLAAFVKLPPSPLERSERLEQLRALESGWTIHLEPARHFARGIDTPEDLEAARARIS